MAKDASEIGENRGYLGIQIEKVVLAAYPDDYPASTPYGDGSDCKDWVYLYLPRSDFLSNP